MTKVKKIADWLKEREKFQFEVIQRDSAGIITSVKRIKDQQIFSLNVEYPALRFDVFMFTEFYEDQYRVAVENYNNKRSVSFGIFPIDDIYWAFEGEKNGYTDRLTEKTIKEYREIGREINFAKE